MPGQRGFFAEGWRELARKVKRLRWRRHLAAKDRDRQKALTRLGQAAWQAKVDLTNFAELRGSLEQLDARAGDLSATAARLAAEQTDLQARRQAELTRFMTLLAPATVAQTEADIALRAARSAVAEKDVALRTLDSKLASLTKELAKIDNAADAPAKGGAGAAPLTSAGPAKREPLETQRKALADQAAVEAAARVPLAQNLETRVAESERCAAETARIDGERKAALQPIDAGIERVRQELTASTRDRATLTREQSTRFGELGAVVYERHPMDPALGESTRAVAAVDADRVDTQSAIDGSLKLTRGMPRGTMVKFWGVMLLCFAALGAAGYVYAWPRWSGVLSSPAPTMTTTAPMTTPGSTQEDRVTADELRKDEAVQGFTSARSDPARRKEGVDILEADVRMLGSSADRSSLPMLLSILERGEPELRAAAANAIGMIGPTSAELPALTKALNDPVPLVRGGALAALDHLSDPHARLLALRVRSGGQNRSRSGSDSLTATVTPDATRLGMPIYPGATFQAFASDLEIGRASFSSPDAMQKIVTFYTALAAGRQPVSGEEFSRLYFGGSPGDPSGARAMSTETEAWMRQTVAAHRSQAELQAGLDERADRMVRLPLLRYAETTLYGAPVFLALEVTGSGAAARAIRYVVIFQDQAIGGTGFECQVPAQATRQ